MRCVLWSFGVWLCLAIPGFSQGQSPLRIYVDADFSNDRTSGEAIVLGFRAALHGVGDLLAGHPVEVVQKDHHGTPKRSRATMMQVFADPDALAVIGGKQSPPYLSYGDMINERGLPLLVPWAAAGPVTRLAYGAENFIFRLSVDDTKAGPFLVEQARLRGCRHVAAWFVDTGWGRANRRTVLAAFEEQGWAPVMAVTIDNEAGPAEIRRSVQQAAESSADCAILVAQPRSGSRLINAMADRDFGIQVISHWGILGKMALEHLPLEVTEKLKVRVLQTCGLALEAAGNDVLEEALAAARALGVPLNSLGDLTASAGFVHAFDLGRILIAATDQAAQTPEWGQGIAAQRVALKQALEDLQTQVPGILRLHNRPFSDVTPENPDGHEALGAADLCVTRFGAEGRLLAVEAAG